MVCGWMGSLPAWRQARLPVNLPPTIPVVASPAKQEDQHDNEDYECCVIHGNFLLYLI